jgi:hypothetical protein
MADGWHIHVQQLDQLFPPCGMFPAALPPTSGTGAGCSKAGLAIGPCHSSRSHALYESANWIVDKKGRACSAGCVFPLASTKPGARGKFHWVHA